MEAPVPVGVDLSVAGLSRALLQLHGFLTQSFAFRLQMDVILLETLVLVTHSVQLIQQLLPAVPRILINKRFNNSSEI